MCCVKLYELMKSAGWLVRDLVWGNIAPLILYTDSLRCFLKLAFENSFVYIRPTWQK